MCNKKKVWVIWGLILLAVNVFMLPIALFMVAMSSDAPSASANVSSLVFLKYLFVPNISMIFIAFVLRLSIIWGAIALVINIIIFKTIFVDSSLTKIDYRGLLDYYGIIAVVNIVIILIVWMFYSKKPNKDDVSGEIK